MFHDDPQLFAFSNIPRGKPAGVETKEDFAAQLQDWIVVYPEGVVGNPLNAPKVVRYELNRRGVLNGVAEPLNKGEFLLAHSRVLTPAADLELRSAFYMKDLDLLRNAPTPRHDCFDLVYAGKGKLFGPTPRVEGVVEVTREWPRRAEFHELLRHARLFLSWDSWSAVNAEALLLGAIPVLLRAEPFTINDLRNEFLTAYVPAQVEWEGYRVRVSGLPSQRDIDALRTQVLERSLRVNDEYPHKVEVLVDCLKRRFG